MKISIDHELAESRIAQELTAEISPEKAYDRRWAQAVLDGVDAALRAEYEARRRGDHYEALHDYLFWHAGEPPYSEIAERLGMSQPAIRQAVVRMRKRFGTLLRDHVAFTVDDAEEVDEEVRQLFEAFKP